MDRALIAKMGGVGGVGAEAGEERGVVEVDVFVIGL
jgi:hypothetical protein